MVQYRHQAIWLFVLGTFVVFCGASEQPEKDVHEYDEYRNSGKNDDTGQSIGLKELKPFSNSGLHFSYILHEYRMTAPLHEPEESLSGGNVIQRKVRRNINMVEGDERRKEWRAARQREIERQRAAREREMATQRATSQPLAALAREAVVRLENARRDRAEQQTFGPTRNHGRRF